MLTGWTQDLGSGGTVGQAPGFQSARSFQSNLPASSGGSLDSAVLSRTVDFPSTSGFHLSMRTRIASRATPAQNIVAVFRWTFGQDYINVFEGAETLTVSYASTVDGGQVAYTGPSMTVGAWHELSVDVTLTPSPTLQVSVDGGVSGPPRTDLRLSSLQGTLLQLGAATTFPCGALEYDFDDVILTAAP